VAGVAAERRKEDSISDAGGILKALNYAIVFIVPPATALGIFGVHTRDKALEAGLVQILNGILYSDFNIVLPNSHSIAYIVNVQGH